MRVSWLSRGEDLEFITSMVNEGEVKLFQNPSMIALINYLWKMAMPFLLKNIFFPYLFLNFIPLIFIALTLYH